jgi:hypothetical protein
MSKLSYFVIIFLISASVFSQTTLLTNLVDIPSLQDLAPIKSTNNTTNFSSNLVVNPVPFTYTDPNCAKYDSDNNCLQCSFRYYFNSNRICTKISDQCNTWSDSTGACTSCYVGFRLFASTCVLGVPNCASYSGTVCIGCDSGFNLSGGSCIKNV